jgi:hypothetical protein
MNMLTVTKLSRSTYRGETFTTSVRSGRPKYPPPPRSGNAFAAALFVAIPGLLLLMALLWVLDGIRLMLAA